MDGFERFYDSKKHLDYELLIPALLIKLDGHYRDNPITSLELEKSLNIWTPKGKGSQIREAVNRALKKDILIASCGDGYFLPTKKEDMDGTVEHLRSRAYALLDRAEQTARKAAEKFNNVDDDFINSVLEKFKKGGLT